MRYGSSRTRHNALRAVVIGVFSMAAGLAASAQSNKACYALNPGLSEIGGSCQQAADDPTIVRYQASIAHANAARAYAGQGNATSAADAVQRSYDGLDDAALLALPEPRKRRDKKAWREDLPQFRINRITTYGQAFQGMAKAFDDPASAPGPNAACTTRFDCLNKGLTRLTDANADAALASEEVSVSQRNAIYLLRAQLYEMRGGPTDFDRALENLGRVAPTGNGSQKPGTTQIMEQVALSAGEAAMSTGNGDPIRALGYFQSAIDANPESAAGHAGVCEARTMLGENTSYGLPQRIQEYDKAEPVCVRATQLAVDGARTDAWFKLGDVRNELANLLESTDNRTAATNSRIQTLRLGATAAYESASSSTTNDPDQLLKLAEAYQRSGNLAKAETTYGRVGKTQMQQGKRQDAALAYLEQAEIRAGLPGQFSDSDVIAALSAAENADRGSALPVMKRGELLLKAGQTSQARTAFQTVLGTGPINDRRTFRDIASHQAAANFYLSGLALTAATSDSNRLQAIEYADQAVLFGAGNRQYRELACLARIQRGGTSVTKSDATPLCMLGAGPSDHLLRGMLFMRQAQYTNGDSAKRSVRGEARQALNDGLNVVSDEDVTQFGWPDAATVTPVRTEILLRYLKELSRTCNDATDPFELPGVDQDERAQAKAFLQFYKVRECRRH